MSRSIGNPTSSPRALHVDSSQHISTLHNTSGTYILGCSDAQVKHPPIARVNSRPRAPSPPPMFCRHTASNLRVDARFSSPFAVQCPMEFSTPAREHRHDGHTTTERGRVTRRARRFCPRHLPRRGPRWPGLCRCATVHIGPGSVPLWKDIVPGHTQSHAGQRTSGVDLDQARCDAGHGGGAGSGRMHASLRPQRRNRTSKWG
jgi:hypothetical protein